MYLTDLKSKLQETKELNTIYGIYKTEHVLPCALHLKVVAFKLRNMCERMYFILIKYKFPPHSNIRKTKYFYFKYKKILSYLILFSLNTF